MLKDMFAKCLERGTDGDMEKNMVFLIAED